MKNDINARYGVRFPKETMEKLKYIAGYNGRSINKEIEQLVLRHIASFEKSHGKIDLDS